MGWVEAGLPGGEMMGNPRGLEGGDGAESDAPGGVPGGIPGGDPGGTPDDAFGGGPGSPRSAVLESGHLGSPCSIASSLSPYASPERSLHDSPVRVVRVPSTAPLLLAGAGEEGGRKESRSEHPPPSAGDERAIPALSESATELAALRELLRHAAPAMEHALATALASRGAWAGLGLRGMGREAPSSGEADAAVQVRAS